LERLRGAKQICRSSRFAVETSISGLRPDVELRHFGPAMISLSVGTPHATGAM
jgi:hypothetical protein